MKVTFEKYTGRYYFNDVKPMTFAELELFKEELQAICTDVYAEALQEMGFDNDDCGDACKI